MQKKKTVKSGPSFTLELKGCIGVSVDIKIMTGP